MTLAMPRPWTGLASTRSTAARFLRAQGQERLACLVAHHSGARLEAEERGLVEELAAFPVEDAR
jgi:hypothetical protein